MNEQQLLHLMKEGNSEAMKFAYNFYGPYFMAVCSRYLSSDEDVKDAIHESFIKIFSGIREFQPEREGSLKAWMRRIVINEALQILRQSNKLDLVEYDDKMQYSEESEEEIESFEFDKLVELVRKLPLRYRIVFNLFVFEHKSHREISEILNITPTASSTQLNRAKKYLIKMIKYSKP